jgi:transcriptional regulator with XRE-family HTH domain
MNVRELIDDLRLSGLSDTQIRDRVGISQVAIYKIRNGQTKKPNPSTCKALADAFGYDLKYEHGEPQFYKKSESPPAPDNPDLAEALKIKAYLDELGISSAEELKQCFDNAGAVFGRAENEIAGMFKSLRAIDAIRNLAKKSQVK